METTEYNIKMLFASLWAHKFLIFISTILFIFLSGYYASNQKLMYTASSIFKFEDQKSTGIPLDMAVMAGFGAFDDENSNLKSLKEKVTGRLFIMRLDKSLNFKADSYYNTFNENLVAPTWKVKLKKLLGMSKNDNNYDEVAWQLIINNFNNSVDINITTAKNLEIHVTHPKPKRASEIANVIMNNIIAQELESSEIESEAQLSYLSSTLADALYDYEMAGAKLRDFTTGKSMMPVNLFAAASINLETSKDRQETNQILLNAVIAVNEILEMNNKSPNSYNILRKEHPIIDLVEFRRIFGLNEIVAAFTWPDKSEIKTVLQTLNDRQTQLNFEVQNALAETKKLTKDVENFEKISREYKIAEAYVSVITERVKAQTIMAGYKENATEIYEYASEPIYPSSPNHKIILILGALLGLSLGSTFALILSAKSNKYYTRAALANVKNTKYHSINVPLRRFSKKSLLKLNSICKSKFLTVLLDLKLEINRSKKQFIIVSGLGSKLTAQNLSRMLCINIQLDDAKIAYINFSRSLSPQDEKCVQLKNKDFLILEEFNNLKIISPMFINRPLDFISKHKSRETILDLANDFDYIIMSAEKMDTLRLAKFLDRNDVFHIGLTRKNQTKRNILEKINDILPLEAQLYD